MLIQIYFSYLGVCPWSFSLNICLSSSYHHGMSGTCSWALISKGQEFSHTLTPRSPQWIHQYQNVFFRGQEDGQIFWLQKTSGYHLLTLFIFICLFYSLLEATITDFFRERGRGTERERLIDVRKKHRLVASREHPDRGSNSQHFGAQRMLWPTEPPSQGLLTLFERQRNANWQKAILLPNPRQQRKRNINPRDLVACPGYFSENPE